MAILAADSYQKIDLIEDITLYWPFSTPEGELTATYITDVNPDQDDWKISLPDATLAPEGTNFIINNFSTFSFKLMLSDTTTQLVDIAAGELQFVTLTNNLLANGEWSVTPWGGGQAAITALDLVSSDNTITITGGSLTPPGGNVDFVLPDSLSNLLGINNTGFTSVTGITPLTFESRELISGQNITVVNSDGIAGDPAISLDTELNNVTSIEVGDLDIATDTIENIIPDGEINIVSNGIGDVSINGVTFDTSSNVAVNNLAVNGFFSNAFVPKAWCIFTDTVTGPGNTIVNESSENIASITGSNGVYVITFTTPMNSINYGVMVSPGSVGGAALPPTVYQAFWTVRELTSVTIEVVDASGEFSADVPNGITVMIMSS